MSVFTRYLQLLENFCVVYRGALYLLFRNITSNKTPETIQIIEIIKNEKKNVFKYLNFFYELI